MTISFCLDDILEASGGHLVSGTLTDKRGTICDQIENLQSGQWYIALPGDQSDGHDFLKVADQIGAIGSIVIERNRYPFASADAILVGTFSTLNCLYQLAGIARKTINPKVIAITGSSGKSTTRDMLTCILSLEHKVHSSCSNSPDARTMARTILSMPEDTEFLIIELAQRGRGQISWLGSILNPDIAIITNIGPAHLDILGSIENVANAKCELLETLKLEGTAIIGDKNYHLLKRASEMIGGSPLLVFQETELEEIAVTPEQTIFTTSQNTLFELKSHGSNYLRDAWCAIQCAKLMGMEEHKIAEGLRTYVPPKGRGNRIRAQNDALLIDESHSATPDSIRAATSAFLDDRAVPFQKKYIVLGAMEGLGELSQSLHNRLGNWISELSFEALILLGQETRAIADGIKSRNFEVYADATSEEAFEFLKGRCDQSSAILIDGSDSPELRRLIEKLTI